MLIKDVLIKQISETQELSEAVVTSIISHQFESAHEATANNNSIEISGFAKLIFNQKRAHKQMEKYMGQKLVFSGALEEGNLSENEARKTQLKLATVESNIKHLKPKLHVAEPNDRGVEE